MVDWLLQKIEIGQFEMKKLDPDYKHQMDMHQEQYKEKVKWRAK